MPTLLNLPIKRCRPSEDVVPFSECRQNFSSYINRPRETHRPILITQNGRATTVVMSIAEYEKHEDVISQCQSHLDRVNLSRDVEISRREFAEGKGIPLETVSRNVLAALRKQAASRAAQ